MQIMIVEDQPNFREQISEMIKRWGFETYLIEDFSNILQQYTKLQPDLILLDINLPVFDGFYWCQKIREVSKVPIIFLSSRNTPLDMVMSMNMGGDDYIQKPFHPDVLIAKVNALLRRTYSYHDSMAHVIEHNGVILNVNNGEISYKEKKVELTKNEFKILSILMQNKGSIVSREKIMRKLWEDESFVDDNTLTVNITRVRKKFSELGVDNLITTKKGLGYMIQ
jgi:DNA-binding response OmpR family regulator